jgi:hypothetical protein
MKLQMPGDASHSSKPSPVDDPDWPEHLAPRNPSVVACSHCRKEIPRSAAINPEAGDYPLYFCGLRCYREWLTNHEWARPKPRR